MEIKFSPLDFQILRVLSDMLSVQEKQSLLKGYKWPDNDYLTKSIAKKENAFLANLLCKELQTTQRRVDFGLYN